MRVVTIGIMIFIRMIILVEGHAINEKCTGYNRIKLEKYLMRANESIK